MHTLQAPTVIILLSQCEVCMLQRFISVYSQHAQFLICQRFISVYCQFVFLSGVCATTDVGRTFLTRVHSRKGSAIHSSKPKAQKNRLVSLLRFCLTPFSSRFSSVLFLSISNKYSNPNTNVSLLASPYRKSSKLVNED